MISCVCVTGSTELNSHVRADLIWTMVNSMHRDPGHPFELILVDNCHGPGLHRSAIDQIFETYETVTHLVRNRRNTYHGGGVNQGMALATGDLLLQITDDLEWRSGWLADLTAPLFHFERSFRAIVAPIAGHNTTYKRLGEIEVGGRMYDLRTNAAGYCWGFWRSTLEHLGRWRPAHFADTRWRIQAQNNNYQFILPSWRIARETNLNYLRPWDYKKDKGVNCEVTKLKYIEKTFLDQKLTTREPHLPQNHWQLKNPPGIGPGAYPPEWLREQGVPGA